MQHTLVGITTGVVIGIALCVIALYLGKMLKRRHESKERQYFVERAIEGVWDIPSEDETEVVFKMRFNADMVEKLHRMTILHKFASPSMAIRRAIDLTTQIDQTIPGGGCITIIDDKGATTEVHVPKVRPSKGRQ